MGKNKAKIPPSWPKDYQTRINSTNPILVNFNGTYKSNAYFAVSIEQFLIIIIRFDVY